MIHDQLKQLFELSKIDLEIERIREKVMHVPQRREELTKGLAGSEVSFQEKRDRLAGLEKQKRDLEGELQLSRARLEELQPKLNQIKTNREYQAALKEVSELKKSHKDLEDRILQIMTEAETLQKEVTKEEEEKRTTGESVTQELKSLEEEEKRVGEETKGYQSRKEEILRGVEASLLSRYDRIRRVHVDAVTLCEKGICGGCHMRIPPQLFIEIQKFRSFHACPSCHRILFLQGGSL